MDMQISTEMEAGLMQRFSVGAELEQGLPSVESYVLRIGFGEFYALG